MQLAGQLIGRRQDDQPRLGSRSRADLGSGGEQNYRPGQCIIVGQPLLLLPLATHTDTLETADTLEAADTLVWVFLARTQPWRGQI